MRWADPKTRLAPTGGRGFLTGGPREKGLTDRALFDRSRFGKQTSLAGGRFFAKGEGKPKNPAFTDEGKPVEGGSPGCGNRLPWGGGRSLA
ncbi:MAG: hypothetical protein CM15mP18_3020 [Methanobacteriota archaeon]|nr:MAG: hypothetical protein CM15mP18_3020 [Euryarchaeota archaeon]